MASVLYSKIIAEAEKKGQVINRTKRSINWMRNRAQDITQQRVAPSRMLTAHYGSEHQRLTPRVGDMMMFVYDPKLKKTLPYYDTFPLIFPIKKVKGGFHGINMHYLPYRHRALLMDALLQNNLNNARFDETTRMKLNYNMLKSAAKYKYFKPCYKHYLDKHVQSRFIVIPPAEWDFALFLPTERFKKADKHQVWEDSKRMYRGNR